MAVYSTAVGLKRIAEAVSNHELPPPVVYVPRHVDCKAHTAHLVEFVRNCQGNNQDCDLLTCAVHVPLDSSFPIGCPEEEADAIEYVLSGLASSDVPKLTRLLEVPHCKCCPQDARSNTACSDVNAACITAICERIEECTWVPDDQARGLMCRTPPFPKWRLAKSSTL
jgi:hypothetical protein